MWSIILFLTITFILCILLINIEKFIIISQTFKRDFGAIIILIKLKIFLIKCQKSNTNVPKKFSETAKKYPNKLSILYKNEFWTFERLEKFSNRVANSIIDLGYNKGDTIALFMTNRPEFIAIWLGLAKAGIITALLNTNCKKDSLVHCLSQVGCKAIIFEEKFEKIIEPVMDQLENNTKCKNYFRFGKSQGLYVSGKYILLDDLISESQEFLSHQIDINFDDILFYIFTSGTTGLPKATIVPHSKFIMAGPSTHYLTRLRSDDIIYVSIPLYHGAAGVMVSSQTIIFGNTIALAERFSASKFWDECTRYKCTTAVYIGEMCRYLLLQPRKQSDDRHNVRTIFGLGLRPNIWQDFINRFGIKNVCEYYSSTEGNANLVNRDNQIGACGFIPYYYNFIMKGLYPIKVVQIDEETNEVIRDQNGLCIECKPGEVGEVVGKIVDSDPIKAFHGYINKNENQNKIITNVFSIGDKAFRTFDRIEMDRLGFLYFRDRTGDNFRWKGENVSATEVESVIQKLTDQKCDCIVFGVTVADYEGKAGMAVISANMGLIDMKHLLSQLREYLPSYAIPIFIRFTHKIEITGTYRLIKKEFEKVGYDTNKTDDSIYFLDLNSDKYVLLNQSILNKINSSSIRI